MKTHTITTYSFEELSDEAKQHAVKKWREHNYEIHWQDEIFDSLKAVYKAANITIRDYSLGLCSYSYIKIDLDEYIGDLTGARAFAWIENNLLHKLRISNTLENRKKHIKYGQYYRIGMVKPCPFTGVCYDENFLSCITESIKSGDSLKDIFTRRLIEEYVRILQAEYDDQNSDEYIIDTITANQYEFTENGEMY